MTWSDALFRDAEIAKILSPEAQLDAMMQVEQAYSKALNVEASDAAVEAIAKAMPDWDKLREGLLRDGLVVPELARQLKAQTPKSVRPAIHTGMTSQDVIDTGLVLALRDCVSLFEARIKILNQILNTISKTHGTKPLMGRTRMQEAIPITVADRLAIWQMPLATHLDRLSELKPRLLALQFGGAAGTRQGLAGKENEIASAMAKTLDLANPPKAWHATRDTIAELASWLSLVSGTLGKMGHDISLMAQQGIDEIKLSGGGGSSAMPHKQNPVLAELLVTLARFNATQLAGIHHALVHEQERSGAAWALEWMILPQMLNATGRGLGVGADLLSQIEAIGTGAGKPD